MTRQEARRVALYVSAAWPGTKLSETSIELWADAIQDLPADVAQEAARAMVREVAKFPSVAALRERADRILRQPAPYQPALTYRPAPSTVEERRSSPGLKALGDVVAQLRRRHAPKSSGKAPQSDERGRVGTMSTQREAELTGKAGEGN